MKSACANCNVHELCTPVGATEDLLKRLEALVYVRKRIKAGATLFHNGSEFHALYAIKSGFIKTETLHEDGRAQITGFYMAGEILGFDGIASEAHLCTAVALEDTEVCVIPLDRIENNDHGLNELQHHFYKLMSKEIVRDHTIMMLLGSMHSEERIAAFILNLSHRSQLRGYAADHLILRMKREEIGSYLGMKVETVSRIFTHFQEQGLLEVHQKDVRILDMSGLKKLVNQNSSKPDNASKHQ